MSSRLNPVTDLGEAALAQITLRAFDHDRLMRWQGNERYIAGRHLWLQNDQLRHANALVDFVAVVENFTTQRLLKLRPNLTEGDVFAWEKRRTSWSMHANVDFTHIVPHWKMLQGFIEARNAAQHGLGRLTDKQLSPGRRDKVLADLKSAKISLIGDFVLINIDTVKTCRQSCAGFVLALDNIAPTR
jgi:hypothetical protein